MTKNSISLTNRILLIVAAVAGILIASSFFAFNGGETVQPQEAVALHLPVDLSFVYDRPEAYYDRLDGSYAVIHEDVIWSPNHCEFCTVIEFHSGPGGSPLDVSWATDRQYVMPGAKKMTFFAMGEQGGEEVKFKAAGKKQQQQDGLRKELPDYDVKTKPVKLDKEWKKFEIDLTGADLTGLTNAFGIESRQSAVVFLKEVIVDEEEAEDPLEEEDDDD